MGRRPALAVPVVREQRLPEEPVGRRVRGSLSGLGSRAPVPPPLVPPRARAEPSSMG